MKKLFSMVIITFMIFTLSACTFNTEPETYEVSFTFTDEYEVTSTELVIFDEDFEGSFQELMALDLMFSFSTSDYGTTLLTIEHLNPKTGAFIAISKNGEMSNVGIDLIEFTDGDSFEFEVVWWDDTQKAVDDAIILFLENHASDYVNGEVIDYNVLLALELLGVVDQYASENDIFSVFGEIDLVIVNDYFKAIMLLEVADLTTTQYVTELNTIAVPGPYGQTAYGLLALDSNSQSVDYSVYVTSALADLDTTSPYDLGLDAGGISLVALSNYTDEAGVNSLISEYSTWISTSQLNTGGVKTRDVVWGDTTYPGTENAASISQVIMGLIANDIDPTGVDYTKGDNNLITRLLEYQTDTGSYDWAFDDEYTEDLAFSTPQAFLALVVYQTYANTYAPVNPYDFN